MKIPIRNVFYLLCYAWGHVRESQIVPVHEDAPGKIHDLFGHVLARAVARLLSRGLDRSYILCEDDIAGVRGKLDLTTTLKRNLRPRGRTYCAFDEFGYDVLHNQIVKATLRRLKGMDEVDRQIRERLNRLHRKMDAVSDIEVSPKEFRKVQVHRNNRLYDFVLRVCRLVHENVIVDPVTGRARFFDFRQDEARMWQVFQDFVFNFFRREQRTFRVGRPRIEWHDARGSDRDLLHLPVMETDVVLESAARCIVLDTKFYPEPLKGRWTQKKVDSGHLYQIFAYLENRAANLGTQPVHEGLLLYPAVEEAFAFEYRLKGHRIRVRTIDLDQPWQGIHEDMLTLVN